MGELQSGGEGSAGLVPDDHPCCAGETLVYGLGGGGHVGVGVCRHDEGGVDAGHPELGEGAVEGGEDEGRDVEEERTWVG